MQTQGQPVDILCAACYRLWNVRRALPAGIAVSSGTDFLFYLLGGEEFQSFRGEMTKEHFQTLFSTDRMRYFLYSLAGAFSQSWDMASM